MFRNYLKTTIRNLSRNKTFSFINIFGLATGIACTLLIFLFVKDETSYDNFHKDGNNIYRVVKDFINDDGSIIPDATTPGPLGPAMEAEIPEIASITRIRPTWGDRYLIKYDDKKLTEEKVFGVDKGFFDVFTFRFVEGNARNAFKEVNSIVLTESSAKKLFGKEAAIGKTVNVDAFGDMMVSAVIEDVPSNSHFHFDYLVSYGKQPGTAADPTDWTDYNDYTYVKTKPGIDLSTFIKKIQQLNDRNVEKSFSRFYVQPLRSIHLTSNLKYEQEPNGDKQYVYIFSLIALFVVVIAAINFMNLSTAKASVRAKEIGVRKVAGAHRHSLIKQFLFEAVIICLIAAVIAMGIVQLLLPVVNALIEKQLSLFDVRGLLYVISGSLLLGIVTGFFPALYLSSFRPITVLKGLKINEGHVLQLRKTLVVVQFVISIVLIIGAVIISQQMQFISSTKLGLDTDQITVLKTEILRPSDRTVFKNEVKKLTGVKDITSCNGLLPGSVNTTRVSVKGSTKEQQLNFISVDYNYLEVMNIKVRDGRGFSTSFRADTLNNGISGGPLEQNIGSMVVNETAVKELNLSSPVGQQILWSTDKDTSYYITIVGVVEDFHFSSLRNEIKPFAFFVNPNAQRTMLVKLYGNNIQGTLEQIQSKWKEFGSELALDYTFLDETFARLYTSESRFQKVFISLVILGIIIACLGLLGLSIFSAQQKVKEIGIRRVLGASAANIVHLLSKDFLKLVLVAFVIAVPIGWYLSNKWLQDFAYRIDVKWWVFLLAGSIAVLIATLTISTQTIKAAINNPVNSLRSE